MILLKQYKFSVNVSVYIYMLIIKLTDYKILYAEYRSVVANTRNAF